MKAVALLLKQEGKTQKEIGVLLGVARNTVSVWLGNNVKVDNVSSLDSRVKVKPAAFPVIVERVEAGAPAAQVAADFGVTERRIRQIVAKETKQQEAKKGRAALAIRKADPKLAEKSQEHGLSRPI